MQSKIKVAIVCDWLIGTGGAEKVVYELHKIYPDAPIYTSQYIADPKVWHGNSWFADADVRTLWLQKAPKKLRKFLPFFRALAFSRLDLSDYDLVISSSGAEAKGIKTGKNTYHVNYCHAPTHYYWSRYNEYLQNPGFGKLDLIARLALKILVGPLRKWDYKAAQKPNLIIANSNHIKKLIKEYYGRDSVVVHPPVDVKRFDVDFNEPRRGFVIAGRQTPYKRFDLAVEAFNKLAIPLLVLGNGPDHKRLVKMAEKNITFFKRPSDEQLIHYFSTSVGFIFPGTDDFGIVAVEALAAGTPLVAYKAGGALDYVEPGKNGVFFDEATPESLEEAVKRLISLNLSESYIKKSSEQFSPEKFRSGIKNVISKNYPDSKTVELTTTE